MSDQFNPETAPDKAWKELSESTLEQTEGAVAIVTMIVYEQGIVRPLVVTNNQPEYIGDTLRYTVTDIVVQLCSFVFRRPFRCGCKRCSSPEAQAEREVRKAQPSGWNLTKGEA